MLKIGDFGYYFLIGNMLKQPHIIVSQYIKGSFLCNK